MKFLNYFLLLSTVIFYISCSSEEEVLEGNYIAQSVELFNCTNSSYNTIKDFSQMHCTSNSSIGCHFQSLDFLSESQVVVSGSQVDNIGRGVGLLFMNIDTAIYTINDNSLIICANSKCDSTKFSLSGNTLILTSLLEGGSESCEREGVFVKR